MSRARLTLADQALANLLGFLACQRLEDDRTARALAMLAEVAPGVQSPLPVVQGLQLAAAEVLRGAPERMIRRGSVAWCQALLTASAAVSEFLFWRASLAVEAARAEPQAEPEPQPEPMGETDAAE